MTGGLKMPRRGSAATMLSELNAEHSHESDPAPKDNQANIVSNVTTLQRTNELSNAQTNEGTFVETFVPSNESTNVSTKQRSKLSSNGRTNDSDKERSTRLEKAQSLAAEDEIAVVTIRISEKLNEYMDRYVERMNRLNPKRRYRKQDAIAYAFAAFYADNPLPPAPVEEEL